MFLVCSSQTDGKYASACSYLLLIFQMLHLSIRFQLRIFIVIVCQLVPVVFLIYQTPVLLTICRYVQMIIGCVIACSSFSTFRCSFFGKHLSLASAAAEITDRILAQFRQTNTYTRVHPYLTCCSHMSASVVVSVIYSFMDQEAVSFLSMRLSLGNSIIDRMQFLLFRVGCLLLLTCQSALSSVWCIQSWIRRQSLVDRGDCLFQTQ